MSDINVTPLVDVTLVLLIVFMITVPAIVGTAPIKVELPETSHIPAEVEFDADCVHAQARSGGQCRAVSQRTPHR